MMLDRDYKKDCHDLEAFIHIQNMELAARKNHTTFGIILGIISSSIIW